VKLGYARVSTDEQSLEVQREQLKAAGCVLIFEETESGRNTARSELQRALNATCGAVPGITSSSCVLVVTKLDRLARNTRDLLEIVDRINKAGAGLISLGEPWADTTSPAGRMVMTVLAGVAEFERARILERTSEGRALAKRNGVKFGRRQKLSSEQQREARKMLKTLPIKTVARVFKVDRKTIRPLKSA